MKKAKILTLCLIMTLLVSLTGCGKKYNVVADVYGFNVEFDKNISKEVDHAFDKDNGLTYWSYEDSCIMVLPPITSVSFEKLQVLAAAESQSDGFDTITVNGYEGAYYQGEDGYYYIYLYFPVEDDLEACIFGYSTDLDDLTNFIKHSNISFVSLIKNQREYVRVDY